MPRESTINPKGQQRAHPQEFFDPRERRRQVSARPTDPYARPAKVKSGAEGLLAFRDSMLNLTGATSQFIEKDNQRRAKKGEQDALRGKEAPISATQAYMDAFDNTKGTAAVLDYKNAIHDLFEKHPDATPEEFAVLADQLTANILNGRSDAFVKGFVPRAMQIEAQYKNQVLQNQHKHLRDDFAQTVAKRAELGLMGGFNGKQQRADLSDLQAAAKAQGLPVSLRDVTHMYAMTTTRLAARHGRPDFLDWAFTKDDSGYMAAHDPELFQMINSGLDGALSKQQSNEKAAIQAAKQQRKELLDQIDRATIAALETGDYDKAEELISSFGSVMDPNDLNRNLKRLNELRLDENWAKAVNPQSYPIFQRRAAQGLLTHDDLSNMNLHMPRETFIKLVDLNGKAKKATNTPNKQYVDKSFAILFRDVGGATDMYGNLMDVHGFTRQEIVTDVWNACLTKHLEQVGGFETITYENVAAWRKAAREAIPEDYAKQSLQNLIAGKAGGGTSERKPYGIQKAAAQKSTTNQQETPERKGLRDRLRSASK